MSVDICGVCGAETADEKPLYDQDGNQTYFTVACCAWHNVRVVGSADPRENAVPVVGEDGPEMAFEFEIHELD